jgi:hypothetical protein
LVASAKEFDVPIREITGKVACFVNEISLSLWERAGVREKPFRRQLGTIQISAADTIPADIQITNHAHRDGLKVCI